MTNQQKLRAAHKLIQAANILEEPVNTIFKGKHQTGAALTMIRENIQDILDSVATGIVKIKKEKNGVFSYTVTPEIVPLIDAVDWSAL